MSRLFHCSAIGKLMTEPKSKTEGPLSVGARSFVRQLVAQAVFGVEFEVSSKYMEKGTLVEHESIALLNRTRGLFLAKNTVRKQDEWLTGECDLYDALEARGHDLKSSWSLATFPITLADAQGDSSAKMYEWQARGYMALWDAKEWEVNWCMVSTPEHLIGYEPRVMHAVDHIPEHHRVTTWTLARDADKERAMYEKLAHARAYFNEVLAEFDATHRECEVAA